MSENGPPKLRKPGTADRKKEGSSKFKKPETNIREKVSSLKLKERGTEITAKVSSLKSKSKDNKGQTEGPRKLGKPDTDAKEKSISDGLTKNTKRILIENPLLSIIGVIVLIILIVSVGMYAIGDKSIINQTNNTTNQANSPKNHYSDGNISFDYPEGWNVTIDPNNTSSQYDLIVTVSKNENNSVSIFRQELGTRNFTYSVAAWRSNILKNGMIYYEGDLNIDNTTAYELSANYKPADTVFTTRGIAFKKNNTAYFIIFVFDEALLDYKNEMDKVLNSFHVTETKI